MPDTISPVTREEDYLAAIAGQDVTPPTPVTRKEEWLDLIAGKVDDLAGDLSTAEGEIDDLQDIVPTPAADDSGKVLTAGADGTASWQTASGGGGPVEFFAVTVTPDGQGSGTIDKTFDEIQAAYYAGKIIYVTSGNTVVWWTPATYTEQPQGGGTMRILQGKCFDIATGGGGSNEIDSVGLNAADIPGTGVMIMASRENVYPGT